MGGCHGVFAVASSPMLSPTLAMGSEMGWVFTVEFFFFGYVTHNFEIWPHGLIKNLADSELKPGRIEKKNREKTKPGMTRQSDQKSGCNSLNFVFFTKIKLF